MYYNRNQTEQLDKMHHHDQTLWQRTKNEIILELLLLYSDHI